MWLSKVLLQSAATVGAAAQQWVAREHSLASSIRAA